MTKRRSYNGSYRGEHLNYVAFPMGGIGAGMICLEGTGTLSHFSLRNKPEMFNEPYLYAALCLKGLGPDGGHLARVLEGPAPAWKRYGIPGAGTGWGNRHFGLPHFASATFQARFPFGMVKLRDPALPVEVELTGWSPFVPGDADHSSLPVAAVEYRLRNRSASPIEAVFSFNARHRLFLADGKFDRAVVRAANGIVFKQDGSETAPWERGQFYFGTDAPGAVFNSAWFRGGWNDPPMMAWADVKAGRCVSRPPEEGGATSPGGSFFVPLSLAPGEAKTVRLQLAWHVPVTKLRIAGDSPGGCCGAAPSDRPTHVPWYAGRFADVAAVAEYWHANYERLRRESRRFSRCFYDTTLPPEIVEAAAANLTILKSPTVLRQTDGRLWAWEGCCDEEGCCHGSCTHVWNYAQALPHLFPELEQSLRQTEFHECQDERGHQDFRAALPIGPTPHTFHAAADGQLGGILKVHREWRISGDTEWLRGLWSRVKQSLDYSIATWDPDRRGAIFEPHHNTYDIEFWGPEGMGTSFYLGALQAAVTMGAALGEDVAGYRDLLARGRTFMEKELFDGDYFIQKIQWKELHAADPTSPLNLDRAGYSPEGRALLEKEGPRYQYGGGCLSDGVLGAWLAAMCGVSPFLDPVKERRHVASVYRYNLRHDLTHHENLHRPTYAVEEEGGLLLCSWPKGGALSLPFIYNDEVWTGIEYQVAGHAMMHGLVKEGLDIVRTCRDRYDGRRRNPFNEYECGHWYARAMSSYGLLQAYGGARYDAVDQVLCLAPAVAGDYRVFLCTATGYGTTGVRDGQPFLEVVHGTIPVKRMDYRPAGAGVC